MSEPEDIEDVRERKRRELLERTDGDEIVDTSGPSPGEPIHVEGPVHLDELTSEHDVVLVDFYADWCGPCRLLEPALGRIASGTDAVVAKVDVDAHPGLSERASVRGVPTLVLYARGEPTERLVGVQDEARLRELIERYA